jgi:D-arabinose 1-dehydrogenase-like Zn-dependent alcohol dehydrogenase
MRAVMIRRFGGPDVLEVVDDFAPSPVGRGQARIRIAACGVCHRDLLDREGKYPFMRLPVVTGHEWSGTIVELGPETAGFAVGDRVVTTHRPACGQCAACRAGDDAACSESPVSYGHTVDGGYAEEVLAWTGSLVRVPDGVALDEAAVLHCTAAVALRALRRHARLVAGERVLVTGASGGVGVHALQIVRALGGRAIALTSSAAKEGALRAFGAEDVVVAAPGAPFHKEVRARTGGAGVDVALELVGAPTANGALRSLRTGGRLVLVGNVTGDRLELNPGFVILHEVSLLGSRSASRAELAEVLAMVEAGALRPIVAERLPLEAARAAQERLAGKGVVGRLILSPAQGHGR